MTKVTDVPPGQLFVQDHRLLATAQSDRCSQSLLHRSTLSGVCCWSLRQRTFDTAALAQREREPPRLQMKYRERAFMKDLNANLRVAAAPPC
jgi:hypothetical protein